jgi:hypothetical protein
MRGEGDPGASNQKVLKPSFTFFNFQLSPTTWVPFPHAASIDASLAGDDKRVLDKAERWLLQQRGIPLRPQFFYFM